MEVCSYSATAAAVLVQLLRTATLAGAYKHCQATRYYRVPWYAMAQQQRQQQYGHLLYGPMGDWKLESGDLQPRWDSPEQRSCEEPTFSPALIPSSLSGKRPCTNHYTKSNGDIIGTWPAPGIYAQGLRSAGG